MSQGHQLTWPYNLYIQIDVLPFFKKKKNLIFIYLVFEIY